MRFLARQPLAQVSRRIHLQKLWIEWARVIAGLIGIFGTIYAANPPFTVLEAREFGSTNQFIVQFSEAVPVTAVATTAANYTLSPASAKVTSVTRHPVHSEMVLVHHTGTPVDVTISNLKNAFGTVVTVGNRTTIDRNPARPRDAGTTVNGFQDDFTAPVRNPVWHQYPEQDFPGNPAQDRYLPTNGVLRALGGTLTTGPSWLVVTGLLYDATNQEVLIRLRATKADLTGPVIGGAAVGLTFPESPAATFLHGQEWVLGGNSSPPTAQIQTHFSGATLPPTVPTLAGTTRTNWFWLRLRHQPSDLPAAVDTEAHIWLADGSTPEPVTGILWNYWDPTLGHSRTPTGGLAGLVGPEYYFGDNTTEFDYFLLKAEGLPKIVVKPDGQNSPSVSVSSDQTRYAGETFTLEGSAAVDGPFTFQWRHEGIPINGATQAVLTLRAATATQSGTYDLVARNPFGAGTSGPVVVRIVGESFYANDFNSASVGPEWSEHDLRSAADGLQLGNFSAQPVTLRLARPSDARPALVTVDLVVIGPWAGLTQFDGDGPDVFEVGVPNGPRLLRTTFSNLGGPDFLSPPEFYNVQNFPGEFGGPRFLAEYGAIRISNPASYPRNVIYRLRFLVPGTGPEMAVQFAASGFAPSSSARWALDNVVVTLLPADQPTVRFEQRAYRIGEDAGSLSLPIERFGPLDATLEVPVRVLATSSARTGVNFELPSQMVHFAAGASRSVLQVLFLPDLLPGPPLELALRLDGPTIIPGDIAETVITIDDAQSGFRIEFPDSLAVHESVGLLTFNLRSYGDSSTGRLVDFDVQPGTAQGDLAYSGPLHVFLWPRITEAQLELPIFDNSRAEPDRTFRVKVVGALGGRVQLSRTDVLLLDNDSPKRAGFGIDGPVYQLAALANGTVLARGNFTTVQGERRQGIARLKGDGTLDPTFQPEWAPSWDRARFAILSDNSVVYPAFPTHAGVENDRSLVRINSSGILISAFHPVLTDTSVSVVAQTDGRLLVFGDTLSTVDDQPQNGLARLRDTGVLDTSFDVGDGPSFGSIESVNPLPGGKILITGPFFTFAGVDSSGFVRLLSSGAVDSTYKIDQRFLYSPTLWLVLRDGRQLVGGEYDGGDGSTTGLIQLNVNGGIVAPVPLGAGENGLQLETTLELSDHRVLLAVLRPDQNLVQLLRLKSDLSGIDPTFLGEIGGATRIRALAEMPDKSIIVAGDFPDLFGRATSQLRRLTPDGANAGWSGEAPAPHFTKLPVPVTVRAGENAIFQAEGIGNEPVTYLWFKGLQPILVGTNALFVISAVRPEDAENYSVLLRTSTRDVLSSPVTLTVRPPPIPPRLATQRTATGLSLTFHITPGIRYRLEFSDDLVAWALGEPFTAEAAEQLLDITPDTAARYWRLRALP